MVVSPFHLTVSMEGTYVGCALFGSIVGVLGSGRLEGVGRKRALLLSSILYAVSAVGCTVSNSFAALVLYREIGGAGIGISAVVAPAYISEIAPARHRGRLVSLYQLAITVGFLAAYVVNYSLLEYSQTADGIREGLFAKVFVDECWRGMLFVETLAAVAFILLLLFIPDFQPQPDELAGRQDCGRGGCSAQRRAQLDKYPEEMSADLTNPVTLVLTNLKEDVTYTISTIVNVEVVVTEYEADKSKVSGILGTYGDLPADRVTEGTFGFAYLVNGVSLPNQNYVEKIQI